nr:integrase, catalytic region, zinc finger, CCHC-type, peptidase aspartic, catalytic [Tanacetum cinerariifolium]
MLDDFDRQDVLDLYKLVKERFETTNPEGCSKHMMGDCSRLRNFMKKFIGTVRFENDHYGAITGYDDYMIGDNVISRNCTLVEAARTMLIFSKAPLFLCAEAVATTFLIPVTSAGTPSSTTIDQDAPSSSQSPSSLALQSTILQQGVAVESTIMEDNSFAPVDNDPFVNVFAPEPRSEATASGDVSSAESTYVTQTHYHLGK